MNGPGHPSPLGAPPLVNRPQADAGPHGRAPRRHQIRGWRTLSIPDRGRHCHDARSGDTIRCPGRQHRDDLTEVAVGGGPGDAMIAGQRIGTGARERPDFGIVRSFTPRRQDGSAVEVHYRRDKPNEQGDRSTWPWLPGTILSQCGSDDRMCGTCAWRPASWPTLDDGSPATAGRNWRRIRIWTRLPESYTTSSGWEPPPRPSSATATTLPMVGASSRVESPPPPALALHAPASFGGTSGQPCHGPPGHPRFQQAPVRSRTAQTLLLSGRTSDNGSPAAP